MRRALCLMLLGAWAPAAAAQQVRVTGTTTFRYVDVRPLMVDSVSASDVLGDGLFRRTLDGYLVRCIAGADFCRFTRPASTLYTVPAMQDLSVSVWGFGRGLRGYAQIRGRTVMAGEDGVWPQANDNYDALVAYVELQRATYRVRAGRQWKVSGLGYYSFDGGSALYRLNSKVTLEGFAGWSLARGLNEARTSDNISAIESFAPDDRGIIVGGSFSANPLPGLRFGGLYQREIRTDREGLYSERVAFDASLRRGGMVVQGSLEVDVASRTVNEAELRASRMIGNHVTVGAHARTYTPFFELWTIWGAFSPVGFTEGGVRASWRSTGASTLVEFEGSYREYEETSTSDVFGPIRSTGWLAGAAVSTDVGNGWGLQGSYRADIGFGAAKTQEMIRIHKEVSDDAQAGVSIQAFQRLFEFRVSEGTVIGVGGDGSLSLGTRAHVVGSVALYRHLGSSGSPEVDWSQLRGTLQIRWTVGSEPGVPSRVGAVR